MTAEKDFENTTYRERLAEEVRQLLFEELRKASAQKDWQRIATISYYIQGSK